MQRKILTLFTLICLALPIQASAYTFQSLPIASKSKQWYIEIDKSHNVNKQAIQPKQGVFDTYSLLVKNIGHDVSNVSVEILDNNPTSKATFKPTTPNEIPTILSVQLNLYMVKKLQLLCTACPAI